MRNGQPEPASALPILFMPFVIWLPLLLVVDLLLHLCFFLVFCLRRGFSCRLSSTKLSSTVCRHQRASETWMLPMLGEYVRIHEQTGEKELVNKQ